MNVREIGVFLAELRKVLDSRAVGAKTWCY